MVGRVGRRMLKERIPFYVNKYEIDFVIANGENATHGKGLNRNHYFELLDAGVDVITLGNHYMSKSDILRYIDGVDRLVRPLNLLKEFPGEGSVVFEVNNISVRVTNVLGSAFMDENVNSPYYSVITLLSEEEPATIHIVDFHAEATSEKLALSYYLDGRVSVLFGTHTHVQTADAKILPNGTGYISDLGMTGPAVSVLGVDKNIIVDRFLGGVPKKFAVADGKAQFCGAAFEVDENSKETVSVTRIYEEF